MQPRMTLIHFPWITTPDRTQGLVHDRQALCQGNYIPNPEFCFLLTKTLLMTGSLSKRRYTCFLQLHCFVKCPNSSRPVPKCRFKVLQHPDHLARLVHLWLLSSRM